VLSSWPLDNSKHYIEHDRYVTLFTDSIPALLSNRNFCASVIETHLTMNSREKVLSIKSKFFGIMYSETMDWSVAKM
jgi:hypothetical protein